MKLNIKKLLAGGGFGMLFSAVADPSSNAAQLAAVQGSSSSKDSSSSDSILSKEVLNELRRKGLPNEVDRFEQILAQLETKINKGLGVSSSELASVRAMANRIIQQSSYLNTAIDIAKDNKSLGDTAIDQDGFIYATDKEGKLLKVAFNKFDSDKYNPLSYAELAEYRRNSPELINNADIIKTIQSSIGSEKINDFIQNILSKIGNSETKLEAYESLASIRGINPKEISNQELDALRKVASAASLIGLDAIFKTSEFRKNDNVALAMQYIMSILPKQMRAQLLGSYIAQGGSYKDSKAYPVSVILTASLAAADNAYHFGIDYDSAANTAAGTKAGTQKPKLHDLTMMELFFNGDLNNTTVKLSDTDYDNKTALEVRGTVIPGLTTDKNQAVTNLPLSLALSGLGMGKYLDYSKIFMGYQHVPEGMLLNIAYTKDLAANVWLPVDSNGDIDFRALHNYSAAEKEIELNGVTSVEEKNNIHRKHGSPAQYTPTGQIVDNGRMAQFLMVHGYTIDDYIDSNNSFVKELTGGEEDLIDEVINSIYKSVKKTAGFSKIAGKQRHDDIIQVPVFIKIQDNAAVNAATYAGYGSLVDTNTLEQTMQIQDLQNTFTASGADLYINL